MVFTVESAIQVQSAPTSLLSFACGVNASDSDGNKILSGEEKDDVVCDAPGTFFDESGEGGCSALAWQVGDLPAICDKGASCHMSCPCMVITLHKARVWINRERLPTLLVVT